MAVTPVKKNLSYNVNNFCRICNVNLLISGCGRFNLFHGVLEKEQTASRLSSILGFVLSKDHCSSIMCVKCRRTLERFEKFTKDLSEFKQKAKETDEEQKQSSNSSARFKR